MKTKILTGYLLLVFFTMNSYAQNKITGYQYAFNDGQNIQFVNVSPTNNFHLDTDLDVSSLESIINTIHIRFLDEAGNWSSIVSKIFIKPLDGDGTEDVKITSYEYFFNDDIANKKSVSVNSTDELHLITDMDISSLSGIINTLNIRFKDSQGRWSPLISKLFIKPLDGDGTEDVKITSYEYFFNDDIASKKSINVNSTDEVHLITDMDVSSLSSIINTLNIRFKDSQGRWSPLISKLFIKPLDGDANSDTKITGYEYYFNNDISNKKSIEVSATDELHLVTDFDVAELTDDLNIINIRFKNDKGKWSPMVYKLFFKPPKIIENDVQIISYQYWVDNDVQNIKEITLSTKVDELHVSELDLRTVWAGEHFLHTRYKDSEGKYSVITNDSIIKEPYSYAIFNTETDACAGSNVLFSNNSIDYDSQTWDFGDGTTSTEKNPSHVFLKEGTYNVKLSVTRIGDEYVSDTIVPINVFNTPSNTVSLSETSPVCFGSKITLTADELNANYLWSTGETTKSIEVSTSGTYNVVISNPLHPDCSVASEDIEITMLPELDNQVITSNDGETSCFGEPVTLTATAQENVTYLWNTGETTQNIEVTDTNVHTVTITSTLNNNCSTISDEIQVNYYPEIDDAVENNESDLCALQENATYQWLDCDNDGTPIAGATDRCFTPTTSGNYSVKITQNECTVVSECFNMLSIPENMYHNVKVYPNPISGKLFVEAEYKILEVEFYNTEGVKVLHKMVNNKKIELDTKKLPSGIYMVKLMVKFDTNSNKWLNYKIIKK
jgi:predicted secreted protein